MAPRPLPQVGRPPPTIAHSMAPYGTQQSRTLPPNHSTFNGTLQWHPAMAPRPLPQVGRHPPPQP